jgi:hypothetical protein
MDVIEIGLPGREVDANGLGLWAKSGFGFKRIEPSGPIPIEVVLRMWKQCVSDWLVGCYECDILDYNAVEF